MLKSAVPGATLRRALDGGEKRYLEPVGNLVYPEFGYNIIPKYVKETPRKSQGSLYQTKST